MAAREGPSAAPVRIALVEVLVFRDLDVALAQDVHRLVEIRRRDHEGVVELRIAGHVRLDVVVLLHQHEIILAALHEGKMVVDPRDAAADHVAIPFRRLHMIAHGNGEMQHAVGVDCEIAG